MIAGEIATILGALAALITAIGALRHSQNTRSGNYGMAQNSPPSNSSPTPNR